MDFLEVIEKRHSVRKYSDRPVEKEVLDAIVRVAQTAPSSRNSKSSTFMIVEDRDTLDALSQMRKTLTDNDGESFARLFGYGKNLRDSWLCYKNTGKMPANIVLCGIKHCGKTTIGQKIAAILDMPLTDSDMEIEKLDGKNRSCREIFKSEGEEYFRKLEASVLGKLAGSPEKKVIALGGGALSNPFFTAEDRKKLGFICCLDVPDEVAYRRVAREGLPPFLQGEKDPFGAFCRMNDARREVFRREAHACIVPDVFERLASDVAQHVLEVYKEKFYE